MKDGRVTVWDNSPTAHLTGTTSNTGPTIDLQGGYSLDGGTSYGTTRYGIGVEIIQTWVSGTAQVVTWTWQTSADNSTWVTTQGYIGASALAAAGSVIFKTSLQTQHRYCRLLASCAGTGASTSVAYAEDIGPTVGTMSVTHG